MYISILFKVPGEVNKEVALPGIKTKETIKTVSI